jgi:hypothetical protein
VHPGAADLPDLAQLDSNCDGIDGTADAAVFVSPKGDDANPGTMAAPKATIEAAVATAASFAPLSVRVRGALRRARRAVSGPASASTAATSATPGLRPVDRDRRHRPQGALADGATGVVLQLFP